MWNRFTLKERAKTALKRRYGSGVLLLFLNGLVSCVVTFVVFMVFIFAAGPMFVDGFHRMTQTPFPPNSSGSWVQTWYTIVERVQDWVNAYSPGVWIGLGVLVVVCLLYRLGVSNALRVGCRRWFLRNAESEYELPVALLFSALTRGQYGPTVRAMFWRNVWLFIWSLPILIATIGLGAIHVVFGQFILEHGSAHVQALVQTTFHFDTWAGSFDVAYLHLCGVADLIIVIFGILLIIKRYSYRMVPYLVADNPRIGALRALRLSKWMTRGNKGGMFVLDLSFVGWILLAFFGAIIIAPIAPYLLAGPYIMATNAELYGALRNDAVASGRTTMEALGYEKQQV